MRVIASALVAAGAVAGIAGAVVAYQATSSPVPEPAGAIAPATTPAPPPAVKVQWLPCEHGTHLVKGVCVRVRHQVVVRSAPVAAAARTGRTEDSRVRTGSGRPATDDRDDDRADDRDETRGDDGEDRDDRGDETRDGSGHGSGHDSDDDGDDGGGEDD